MLGVEPEELEDEDDDSAEEIGLRNMFLMFVPMLCKLARIIMEMRPPISAYSMATAPSFPQKNLRNSKRMTFPFAGDNLPSTRDGAVNAIREN